MSNRAFVAYFVLAAGATAVAQGKPAQPSPRAWQPETRMSSIICGTRVFRADPRMDSKAVKPVPNGTFTLRTQTPSVCRDTFPAASAELRNRLPYFFGPRR